MFKCAQLHIHTSCPSTSQVLFETIFWKLSERILFNTLRHLQSFLVAFIEQVQKIEVKASVVEAVSCFATVKAQGCKRDNQMYNTYQAKLNQH